MNKSILLVCSASKYRKAFLFTSLLKQKGITILTGPIGQMVKKTGNYSEERDKPWLVDESKLIIRTSYLQTMIHNCESVDALLVMNFDQKNRVGYIGGSMLMAMTIAFYLHKAIYLYQSLQKDHPFYEEVYSMLPIVIEKDVEKISLEHCES